MGPRHFKFRHRHRQRLRRLPQRIGFDPSPLEDDRAGTKPLYLFDERTIDPEDTKDRRLFDGDQLWHSGQGKALVAPSHVALSSDRAAAQTSRIHQAVPMTDFGDAFDAVLSSKEVNDIPGVMVNTISAYQQFPDAIVSRWNRYLPAKPSTYQPANVDVVLTTLNEYLAMKVGDRALTGWTGVSSASFTLLCVLYPSRPMEKMKVGDRPLTGWTGVSSASFHSTVRVVPIATNELRDASLWLYVTAFVDRHLAGQVVL
ncbi:unnamed protein product [Heligmosomoides polygyrus]|uniref:Capsid protein n=1 Tax=Heligmosomoides polygyrus TaxID=6339 RepID=A0A183FH60_HELPZ|nr:unnamed protein product [Heligmosomoides polygyrus]